MKGISTSGCMVYYRFGGSVRHAKYTGCLQSNTNASINVMCRITVRGSAGYLVIMLASLSDLGLLVQVSLKDPRSLSAESIGPLVRSSIT